MKPDLDYLSRLEVGDTFKNTRGETCKVTKIDKYGTIESGTLGRGDSYLRIYDKTGNGSLGDKIETDK